MIILDYKNKELKRIETAEQVYWLHFQIKVKITKMEARLLMLLSNNNVATIDDISRFLYGTNVGVDKRCICALIYRIREKFNLKITTINRGGYRLEDEIYIDY